LESIVDIIVLIYFTLSYSISVMVLFYSFLRFLLKREGIFLYFLLLMMGFFIIIVINQVLNQFSASLSPDTQNILRTATYFTAGLLVYFLPFCVNKTYAVKNQAAVNWIFLGAAAALSAALVVFILLGLKGMHIFTMTFIAAAIAYAMVIIVRNRRVNYASIFKRNFRFLFFITLFASPILLYVDFLRFDTLLRPLLHFQGPVFLPLIMIIWGLHFLFISIRADFKAGQAVFEVPAHFIDKHAISQREKQVMLLLLQGKSYKQIRHELFISMSTVKYHAFNIYRKTGTCNRMELALLITESQAPV
jgi:DNA-binding CsgD family transcriptional regulator